MRALDRHYTLRNLRVQLPCAMLEHLIDFDPMVEPAPQRFAAPEKASATTLLAAQTSTTDWLASLGAPSADTQHAQLAAAQAQSAFQAVVTDKKAVPALLEIKTPEAVRHLTGMLTAYDWAFVEKAQQLRGYAVAKILEEVEHPDARIRLRALELLGRVTEVALFTDRMEVKKTDISESDIDARIKEKLARFLVVDVESKPAT